MITNNLDTLKMKSEPITEDELEIIIQALEDDLSATNGHGVGLSGIQISIPKRVAIIRHTRKVKIHGTKKEITDSYNLYNAEIIEKSQPFIYKNEGCLSVPGEYINTNRYNRVKIKNGNGEIYDFSGFLAVVAQHEIDHWDGILFSDRAVKENV